MYNELNTKFMKRNMTNYNKRTQKDKKNQLNLKQKNII